MEQQILTLPWQLQLALGSGYVGYLIAYAGIRDHHKSVDIAFRAIAFGLVATITLYQLPSGYPVISIVAAFTLTVLVAAFWRLWGRRLMRWAMRNSNLSWADDTPSAWSYMQECTDRRVSQISILLDDGQWINCDDVNRFKGAAFAPFVLGGNGDALIYATSLKAPDGTVKQQPSTRDDEWGDAVTYVPAARIRKITTRWS